MAEPILTDIDSDPGWWNDWFEADYSWEGLAGLDEDGDPVHLWRGWKVVDEAQCVPESDAPKDADTRPATLQDYWRADPEDEWRLRSEDALKRAGELLTEKETPDGRVWHIVHVPQGPRPGEPVKADAQAIWFKADLADSEDWARLEQILRTRLAAAGETEVDYKGDAETLERRALLHGAVLRTVPALSEDDAGLLHLSARRSVHLSSAAYSKARFGPGTRLTQARFAGDARFYSASFAGDAWFDSASFAGYARFDTASFAGVAWFDSASFAGNAWFDSASFAGNAWFASASFAVDAGFDSASFAGNAWFDNASFLRRADFQRGSPPAQRAGRLLRAGEKTGLADLRATNPDLTAADYALVLNTGAARRETGAFGRFSFDSGLALGAMAFHDRVFGQQPDFERASFHGPVQMFQAELHDGVLWRGAQFRYEPRQAAMGWDALAAHLSGRTGFDSPPDARTLSTWRKAAARDEAPPDADLSVQDRIRQALWVAAAEAHSNYLAAAPAAFKAASFDLAPGWAYNPRRADTSLERVKAAAANKAPDFEQAYRRLKLLMGQQGAHLEEQRFFALELRARQARAPGEGGGPTVWEIAAARAYGLLADYGASLMRPLAALFAVWLVLFACYAGLALSQGVLGDRARCDPAVSAAQTEMSPQAPCLPKLSDLAGPLVFSLEITFAPIANPIRHHPWAGELAGQEPEISAGAPSRFAALRLFHRILAVPLLFLLALSLRRRFQMG